MSEKADHKGVEVPPPAADAPPAYAEVFEDFSKQGLLNTQVRPGGNGWVAPEQYPQTAYTQDLSHQPQSYPPAYPSPAYVAPDFVKLETAKELTREEIEAPAEGGKIMAGLSFMMGMNRVRCQVCTQQLAWDHVSARFARCPRCREYSVRETVTKPHTPGVRYVRCRCNGLFMVSVNSPGYVCPREGLVYYLPPQVFGR